MKQVQLIYDEEQNFFIVRVIDGATTVDSRILEHQQIAIRLFRAHLLEMLIKNNT